MLPLTLLVTGTTSLYALTGTASWILRNVINPIRGIEVVEDPVTGERRVNTSSYVFALTDAEARAINENPEVGRILRNAQKRSSYFEKYIKPAQEKYENA